MNHLFHLRLITRAFWLRRRRLSIAFASLAVGACLSGALLNTYGDLDQKMAGEFRRFGANILVAPGDGQETLEAAAMSKVEGAGVSAVPFLYVVGAVNEREAVLAGTDFSKLRELARSWRVNGDWPSEGLAGLAGERLGVQPGTTVALRVGSRQVQVRVTGVVATGASEDSQLLLPLGSLQDLATLPGRLSVVQVSAPPQQVAETRARLAAALPAAEVRILRQVAESTATVLQKVRGMLFASTVVILTIIALSVATTLTAIVLDRREDIGVMKALGAQEWQVAFLLLAEAALLGLAGGLAGGIGGMALAQWMGQRLYQSSVVLRAAVLPQVLLVSLAVAIAATLFPLRLVRGVSPASVLKGE